MGWAAVLLTTALLLLALALVSRRMSHVTQSRRYYRGLYLASALLLLAALTTGAGAGGLLAHLPEIVQNSLQVVAADALAALGMTIALPIAWFYWSWLLADRDQ